MIRGTTRVGGHFGELIQGRLGAAGPVVLISLPCPALAVTATATPARCLSIYSPNAALLTPLRARKFLRLLGLGCDARVILAATMPPGGGAGSSTAALVALARLAGWAGPPQTLAAACLAVEGATDPLMFDYPEQMLWASRRAKVIQPLPALPAFDIVGGFYGAPLRTDASDTDFPDVSDLVQDWHHAAVAQDVAALANLAATSAQRNLARRGPNNDPTAQLTNDLGALGHVIAHTGSARGLIFAKGAVPTTARTVLSKAGFKAILTFTAGGAA